jgi:hypothetical protein
MEEAQKSIVRDNEERKPMHDYQSRIFEMLKEMCKYDDGLSVDFSLLKKRILQKGFTEEELVDTVQSYLNMNVIMREDNTITLIEG